MGFVAEPVATAVATDKPLVEVERTAEAVAQSAPVDHRGLILILP